MTYVLVESCVKCCKMPVVVVDCEFENDVVEAAARLGESGHV